MTLADAHIALLAARHPSTESRVLPSGARLVTMSNLILPAGWSKTSTNVLFLVPQPYPYAAPDCFWTDAELRLANGCLPQNVLLGNPIPEVGGLHLWFSWHLTGSWNPSRDTLVTWYNAIVDRFRRVV